MPKQINSFKRFEDCIIVEKKINIAVCCSRKWGSANKPNADTQSQEINNEKQENNLQVPSPSQQQMNEQQQNDHKQPDKNIWIETCPLYP